MAQNDGFVQVAGLHGFDAITAALTAQAAFLTKQMQQTNPMEVAAQCEICYGAHSSDQCLHYSNYIPMNQIQAPAIGNFQRSFHDPFSNSYNPGWCDHPNYSWRNNQGKYQHYQGQFQSSMTHPQMNQPEKRSALEAALMKLNTAQTQLTNATKSFITESRSSFKNLETQVGQLAKEIHDRPQGNLPSNTEVNSKEQVLAITLESGKQTEQPKPSPTVVQDEKRDQHSEEEKGTECPEASESCSRVDMVEGAIPKTNNEALKTVLLGDEDDGKKDEDVVKKEIPERKMNSDALETALVGEKEDVQKDAGKPPDKLAEIIENKEWLNPFPPEEKKSQEVEVATDNPPTSTPQPPPSKSKEPPDHLKFVYLGENDRPKDASENLLRDRINYELANRWTLADLAGMSPKTVMQTYRWPPPPLPPF